MSPSIQIDLNCHENKLEMYIYKLICIIKTHDINIKDVAKILYDVIKRCEENSITEPNEIYLYIKYEMLNNYEIEIEIEI